jgi:tRNA-specific 2-thiouridylase
MVGGNDELLRARFFVKDVNWVSVDGSGLPMQAQVKIRNKHDAAEATIYTAAGPSRVEVRFEKAQRAITPGQGAVFYDGDLVLGGGWIE